MAETSKWLNTARFRNTNENSEFSFTALFLFNNCAVSYDGRQIFCRNRFLKSLIYISGGGGRRFKSSRPDQK